MVKLSSININRELSCSRRHSGLTGLKFSTLVIAINPLIAVEAANNRTELERSGESSWMLYEVRTDQAGFYNEICTVESKAS